MRSLSAQAHTTSQRTAIACIMSSPRILTLRVLLPLDLNDIDNYSQMTSHGL
ncbi:hypothetical protein PEC302107_10300 [Pectobacterium araliae]|nr:hypothetical protein PEC302107_10300 [Pectobacterium carotovorum subsp. carotovorum]